MSSSEWNSAYTGGGKDRAGADAVMMETVMALSPGRALDLGCGVGGNAIALAERGWEVLGIDFAERAIDSARRHTERKGVSAIFEVADATSWTAPHEFDLVISNFALPPVAAFHGHVGPEDLVTVDELVSALGELEIEFAGTRSVPPHDHGDHSHSYEYEHDRDTADESGDGRDWIAVLVRARRPIDGWRLAASPR